MGLQSNVLQPKIGPEVSFGSTSSQIGFAVMNAVCSKLIKRELAAESGEVGKANQAMLALNAGAPPTGEVVWQ